MEDEDYIKRCINLAQKALGDTYPNPMVGSVIVHQGKIIGEGFHHKAGKKHAEICAIDSVTDGSALKHSTLYVSLEPCSHFGKTPPCAEALAKIGFRKVVMGSLDPSEKVHGKGKKILEDSGIEVISGVLERECRELNKRFFTFHEKKRPYILLKWAMSGEGFIDKNGRPYPITSSLVNFFTHVLRREEQAILVGTQTAYIDNPILTTRNLKGNNPVRLVIDRNLKIPRDYNIYNREAPTIIYNEKVSKTKGHIEYVLIGKEQSSRDIMKDLYNREIQSVIVEGGSNTIGRFLKDGIWDEACVLINENLYLKKGTKAPEIPLFPYLSKNMRNVHVQFFRNPLSNKN
ncbi:MAG: bifunctional diaminohydroxyphosphoribosylaminopyrimidine deaminase/5-amino-6-(5-phosphoribosylamino)uracil reductase RibD [Bergeyella sp.]|nr:bifunctional diaminohydroxyphosphoribosylaminopyrimidine deaminase/5-amino-6-(5-phosphoribosylamino)uracil reductase RibD [Bergeyella sp.]